MENDLIQTLELTSYRLNLSGNITHIKDPLYH